MSLEKVSAVQGDITKQDVDAIVNAANQSLLGGGGVDGAIHRAAGPELLSACQELGGCPPGQARITPGFRLPAKWVIHTVGPVWQGGGSNESELLTSCYWECLKLAEQHEAKSLAFPNISTGAYGYPFDDACRVALHTIDAFFEEPRGIAEVRLVSFAVKEHFRYTNLLAEVSGL